MEGFFGADLSDVRVHADAPAAQAAASEGAEAFTIGRDIYFGEGTFDPGSVQGKALLGHELTHVLQQRARGPRRQGLTPGSVEALESEAQTVARRFETTAAEVKGGTGFLVNRYLSTYSVNRPATDEETQRLEALSRRALKVCEEILRSRYPDLLEGAARTLDTLEVDIDTSLAGHTDDEITQAWGHRMAAAIATRLSSQSTPTLAAAAGAVLKAPDKGKGQQPATTNITVTTQTFDIEADDLTGAAAALQSLDEWGKTRWNVTYDYDATDGVATSVAVTARITVELPRWTTLSKQPRRVQAEWNRMLTALRRHENEHVRIARERIQQLAGEMSGKPESDLPDIHARCLQELDTLSDAFDQRTDHGAKEGVTLDLNVVARPRSLASYGGTEAAEMEARSVEDAMLAETTPRLDIHAMSPGSVQRKPDGAPPNASMPPPNQSTAPTRADLHNNGIGYQGETLYPDSAKAKEVLRKLLPQKGASITSSWGSSMVHADAVQKAAWSVVADDDYIQRCQAAMQSAVTEFDEENRIFMERFETKAGNLTDAMLTNAEEQIHKEQEKLGLKEEVYDLETGTSTTYTATNRRYLAEAKTAAADLAKRRSLADFRAARADEARKKAQATLGMMPAGFDPKKPLGQQQPAPGPASKFHGQVVTYMSELEMAHNAWQEAEADFKTKASEATAKYALLAPLVTGGKDTAERLKTFAEQSIEQAEQSLGQQLAAKLANIKTVRDELGGRFSIWKQPAIISITHEQMKSGPGEQRMVADKVREIKADEKATQEMYAAIALGLGLLAAIPTGGSSVIAGVALAAAATGAALSAYTAYEEAQQYLLQSAAANTSLDRAYEISKDEPSLLPLAIDIAAAVLDLGAAKAAFSALKETIAIAKAAKSVEKLPEVIGAMRRAHISPGNQAAVIDQVLPAGGDVSKALSEIKAAFTRTTAVAVERETAELMEKVAKKAIDNGRVIVFPSSRAEAEVTIRQALAKRGFKDETLAEETRSWMEEFFAAGKENVSGKYDPIDKLIFIRGNTTVEGAASILVHESTHLGQDAKKMMKAMGDFQSEFEAYKAQQQFLQMIPPDKMIKQPVDISWLREATDDEIAKHIKDFYKYDIEPMNVDAVVDGIFNTLFQAGTVK